MASLISYKLYVKEMPEKKGKYMTIFSIFDYVSSNILLPAGGMFISFFAGWLLNRSFIHDQLTNNGSVKVRVTKAIIFSLKYVAPTGIILVFLSSLKLI